MIGTPICGRKVNFYYLCVACVASMNERKQRFLKAYGEHRTVFHAAQVAGIHHSTVYRWRADPTFVAAMELAWRVGHERWLIEVYYPQKAAREAAHERRNAELRPMRQRLAARARQAKEEKQAAKRRW